MDRYATMVETYMKTEEPERYRQLIAENFLETFCQGRADQAQLEKESLMRSGLADHEADEIVVKDMLTII